MKKRIIQAAAVLVFAAALILPVKTAMEEQAPVLEPGQIYLYGEAHSEEVILEEEFRLWNQYYHVNGMRDLFIEAPYYQAEFMNIWMRQEDDEILKMLYQNTEGTAGNSEYTWEFWKKIKKECPETVFHGTDVGHQYWSTGPAYLQYLEDQGQNDSEEYRRTVENMEQGERYYSKESGDSVYRENKMAENFREEYERLDGKSIMGIYGGAHVGIGDSDYDTGTVPNMASQLYQIYGGKLHPLDLSKEWELWFPDRKK